MKGLRACRMALFAALLACYTSVTAADLYINWTVELDGSLGQGAYAVISGSTVLGGNTVHNIFGDFFFPNGMVGNGTGIAIGTITITADIVAPEGVFIEDIWVYDIGVILPGQFATTPWIAWTELILDMTDTNNPVTLISDSGVWYDLPKSRHYVFNPTRFLRVKEVYVLDGVTYYDNLGRPVIDDTAVVALVQVQKDLSIIPEPSSLAALAVGLGGLTVWFRRRK